MTTPTEYQAGLTIGIVEGVSPDALEVAVLDEAPHGTALGTRWVQHFPTINGYVSIPTEVGPIRCDPLRVHDTSKGERQAA